MFRIIIIYTFIAHFGFNKLSIECYQDQQIMD